MNEDKTRDSENRERSGLGRGIAKTCGRVGREGEGEGELDVDRRRHEGVQMIA